MAEKAVAKKCYELASFKTDDIESIRLAFAKNGPLILAQAWRPEPEPDFALAQVRAGWRDETFYIFAELTDADIFTRAEKNNDKLWELGDVLEIFLQPEGQKSYYEFHVAPNNHWLQLRFPEAGAVKAIRTTGRMDEFLIREPVFKSFAWVQAESKRWLVFAQIPAKTVCEKPMPMAGSRWNFSFSRYDYTHGREKPVISSTSAHTVPSFHDLHEWQTLEFVR